MDLARLATASARPQRPARGRSPAGPWPAPSRARPPGAPPARTLDAAACDATVIPIITGHVDWALADHLISLAVLPWAVAHTPAAPPSPASDPCRPARLIRRPRPAAVPAQPRRPRGVLTPEALDRLRQLVIQHATGLLSGPHGLAAQHRTRTLAHPFTGRSQPLDVGTPTPIVPPHLRRAVTLRDQHCRFPGCTQPPAVCQIHHLTPRATRRPHQPWPTWPAVPVPPPDRHPPLGLDPDLPRRRHHHRRQPRRPHPAQPQPAAAGASSLDPGLGVVGERPYAHG